MAAAMLECSVCHEDFKDPRSLRCGHSFCFRCLEGWLRSAQGGTVSPYTLTCPECRERHVLSRSEGVRGLPRNFAISRAVRYGGDTKPQDEVPMCQGCTQGRPASHRCCFCDAWMCQTCCDTHRQLGFTKHHEILTVKEAISDRRLSISASQYKPCSAHNMKPIEYFCVQCHTPCCQAGSITQHKLHECITLDEQAEAVRMKFKKMLSQQADCEASIDVIDMAWRSASHTKSSNIKGIQANMQELERNINNAVKEYVEKSLSELQKDHEEFEAKVADVENKGCILKENLQKKKETVKEWLDRKDPQEIISREEEMKILLAQTDKENNLPKPAWSTYSVTQPAAAIQSLLPKLFGKVVKKPCTLVDKPLFLRAFTTRARGEQQASQICDISFLNNGNLVMCDSGNARVKIFTHNGELLQHLEISAHSLPLYSIALPGSSDQLLVSDVHKGKLWKWNILQETVEDFIQDSNFSISSPHGLTSMKYENKDVIVIVDSESSKVCHVNTNGEVVKKVEYAVDGIDYIAGHPNQKHMAVVVSSSSGGYLAAFLGNRLIWFIEESELSDPGGVVMTETGRVLVSDPGDHKILQLTEQGKVKKTLLSSVDGLDCPTALAYNDRLRLLAVTEWHRQQTLLFYY